MGWDGMGWVWDCGEDVVRICYLGAGEGWVAGHFGEVDASGGGWMRFKWINRSLRKTVVSQFCPVFWSSGARWSKKDLAEDLL